VAYPESFFCCHFGFGHVMCCKLAAPSFIHHHVLMDLSRSEKEPPNIGPPQLHHEREPVVPERPLPTREELETAALDLITHIIRLNGFNTNQNRNWPLQNETPPTNWTENPGICTPNNRRFGWSPLSTAVEMTEFGSPALLLDR
jgi:hypothetical protein